MNILVTGANGFVGKNLCVELENHKGINVLRYDLDSTHDLLQKYVSECNFVVHLAGVNRPENTDEFMEGNYGFTTVLLEELKVQKNKAPILITSSIQAELDNPYGVSKRKAEEYLSRYGEECNVKKYIYRLSNVFGKWCKPNYNSVVATFCYNIARNIPIQVNDAERIMEFIYIDDLVAEIIMAIKGNPNKVGNHCEVPMVHRITLGRLAKEIEKFKKSRENLELPDMGNIFIKKLYSTYLSYLPENEFAYPLKMHKDERGSFTEFLKSVGHGQVSINVAKSGIVKGQHWHHTKTEKFCVVKGNGLIQFRKIGVNPENNKAFEMIEYCVSGEEMEVVDIPPGYTHNIINTGTEDMVTVMWANEAFNSENPDTFFEVV